MTEITQISEQAEQQNRQNLLKDLFKTVSERAMPLDEKDILAYRGELVNGIIADDITIKSTNARLETRGMFPMIEIHPPNDRFSAKAFLISIGDFGISLVLWGMREKGFMSKYTYGLNTQASGEGYQRFLNENHVDSIDFSSTENIRQLTTNIRNWKKSQLRIKI